MFDKIKQLNDLRRQAADLQQLLAQERVTTQRNGIILVMDGNQKVVSLTIDESISTAQAAQALPGIFNDTVTKIQRIIAGKMQSGGFNLPGF